MLPSKRLLFLGWCALQQLRSKKGMYAPQLMLAHVALFTPKCSVS
jgi:hypothetical protein